MTQIKFCGMTRADDVREAAELGASYVGVILASGPRLQTPEQAARLLDAVPAGVRRVGVFAARPAEEIAELASRLSLDVVQLHGDPTERFIEDVRRDFGGIVWAVARISEATLPQNLSRLFAVADAVLLDAMVAGRLGGTGVAVPWTAIVPALERVRGSGRLVLAGGLTPENVGLAISVVRPDIVDVSSGVETAPGIKDHLRMRAFRDAVRATMVEQ